MNAAAVLTEILFETLSAHKWYVQHPNDPVCLGCPVPQHGTMHQFANHEEFVDHLVVAAVSRTIADPRIAVVDKADADELAEHRAEQLRERQWDAYGQLSDLQCIDCTIRFGERQQHPCDRRTPSINPDYPNYGAGHCFEAAEVQKWARLAGGPGEEFVKP